MSAKINGNINTPKLYEVSPNSGLEQIIEITITDVPSDKTSSVLVPSEELTVVTPTLPADEKRAIVVEFGANPIPVVPQSVTDLTKTLKDAVLYEYPSTDGSTKVLITFTTEVNKIYTTELPRPATPALPATPSSPTSQLFTVETYENIDDVPTENVPAIILSPGGAKIDVKKCAHATTAMPITTAPTICYDEIFSSQVTPVTATNAEPDTPALFEVSPNSAQEQIIDVKLTEQTPGTTSEVLTPSDVTVDENNPTLPADQKKAVVITLGSPETTETTVTPVTAIDSTADTPKLFELTPNAKKDKVTEVTVTPEDDTTTTTKVLTPSESLETTPTLPAGEPKAVVVDLGKETVVPQEITRLLVLLDDAVLYEYTTEDKKKVVVTFTSEANKNYAQLFPPETSTTDEPTSQLFDVKDYTSEEDIPSEEVPAILLSTPGTEVTVKKTETPETTVPEKITSLKDTLKDAKYYEYTSTDVTKKVVVTFTTKADQDLNELLPPSTSTKKTEPTSQIFDVETYDSIDDIPTQEVPAIIMSSPSTKTQVKKCAHATTPPPQVTTYMPTTGPTICYEEISELDVAAVPAKVGGTPTTPAIFEVSPNSAQEQIIELTVENTDGKPTEILKPSSDLDNGKKTLPAGEKKAVVVDLGVLPRDSPVPADVELRLSEFIYSPVTIIRKKRNL